MGCERQRRGPSEETHGQAGRGTVAPVSQQRDDLAARERLVRAQVALGPAQGDEAGPAVIDARDTAQPRPRVYTHHDADRPPVHRPLRQHHEVETSQMRTQQQAAPAVLQHAIHEWQAFDGHLEPVELARRHIDAVQQGAREAVDVSKNITPTCPPPVHRLQEFGGCAPCRAIRQHEIQDDGVQQGPAQRPAGRASEPDDQPDQPGAAALRLVGPELHAGWALRGQAAHAFCDSHGNPVPLCGDTERSTGAIDLADGLRLLLGQQRGDELDLLQAGQLQPGRLLQAMHHAIEQQHARHDGVAGKMPRQATHDPPPRENRTQRGSSDFPFRAAGPRRSGPAPRAAVCRPRCAAGVRRE